MSKYFRSCRCWRDRQIRATPHCSCQEGGVAAGGAKWVNEEVNIEDTKPGTLKYSQPLIFNQFKGSSILEWSPAQHGEGVLVAGDAVLGAAGGDGGHAG